MKKQKFSGKKKNLGREIEDIKNEMEILELKNTANEKKTNKKKTPP